MKEFITDNKTNFKSHVHKIADQKKSYDEGGCLPTYMFSNLNRGGLITANYFKALFPSFCDSQGTFTSQLYLNFKLHKHLFPTRPSALYG